ncbi:amidase domain-containing protein [Paenibacillus lactis]|uniref:amidase domain-containing protein n=1 Tax=Paenibacillus lactis TaxID=228574 RepID=UPI002041B8E1|nr:amidase domain-containing protein [Paenibacillus lactis]MCM3493976.1 amidase domain-containing protein [Paenibacillus lactis]
MSSLQQAEKPWKQSLYIYVNQYNQNRVDYSSGLKEQIVADLNYLVERGERQFRLQAWYEEREVVPLKSETRARLQRILRETEDDVVADVRLSSVFYYEKRGMTHREDIVTRERLTLIRDGDAWLIVGIERLEDERHPLQQAGNLSADPSAAGREPSLPFMNGRVYAAGMSTRSGRYEREAAAAYADRWWDSGNPEFAEFDVDCTNYISQCLFAGKAPIHYTGKRESGWWYKGYVGGREWWSYSWAVSNSFANYLYTSTTGLRGELVERPEQLMLGDVIVYDWDGDGAFQHSTIVTAFDAGGMPLVNAHTVSSRHRYWDYRDSYAWNDKTKYRFYHIPDYF